MLRKVDSEAETPECDVLENLDTPRRSGWYISTSAPYSLDHICEYVLSEGVGDYEPVLCPLRGLWKPERSL
jgi:hypothetical protein